jgi:predicted dehydrogenase
MVRIGIAGLGFMGMIHYLAALRVPGAKVAAVCSRDATKLAGDWRSIRGNFGPPGTVMDLGRANTYERFEDLLADPTIDLVDICTPAHRHRDMTVAALEAGKHVIVEKPIASNVSDAEAMVSTAAKTGRLLMVAHVLPFFPEFGYAAAAVRDGRFGGLLGAHFQRVISKPDWSADHAAPGTADGPAIDLHVHDTHFIALIAGVPDRVFSSGLVTATGSPTYLSTQYLYGADKPAVSCTSGAIAASGRTFQHGFTIYLERATLVYDSGGIPLTEFRADGSVERPAIEASDEVGVFAAEIRAAVEGVRSGQPPEALGGLLARDALMLCHLECQSVASGGIIDTGRSLNSR